MSMKDLVAMSLGQIAEAYAKGVLSPVEVMETTLAHAEAVNPAINALFCFAGRWRSKARRLPRRVGGKASQWDFSMACP